MKEKINQRGMFMALILTVIFTALLFIVIFIGGMLVDGIAVNYNIYNEHPYTSSTEINAVLTMGSKSDSKNSTKRLIAQYFSDRVTSKSKISNRVGRYDPQVEGLRVKYNGNYYTFDPDSDDDLGTSYPRPILLPGNKIAKANILIK